MNEYGLDVSQHNGNLDFNAIKNAGNTFVILRAGFGWSMAQKDPNFETYYQQAKKAGLKVGAYWYSYARNKTEALQEADCFLKVIAGKQFEMPVYIDMEDADGWKRNNGNPSGATQAEIANVFMQRVEDAGYFTGIYASTSWFDGYLQGLSKAFTRWEANWGINDGKKHRIKSGNPMHQYTSVYTLNGKRFDRNVCMEDFTTAIKRAGLNGFSKEEQAGSGFDMASWVKLHDDKAVDVDGVYGYQCVDLFKQLCLDLGMKDGAKAIGGDGYAHQIWYRRKENGYLNYFDEVPASGIKAGDVVIYGRTALAPDSHVGICTGVLSDGRLRVFGQNQGGRIIAGKLGSAANTITLPSTGLLGGLRPKGMKEDSQPAKKDPQTIANEVVAGLWGNGDERRSRLTDAGYDYNEIQNRVNALLNPPKRKSNDQIAVEVINGLWGNGSVRIANLRNAGYDPTEIQRIVNKKLGF